MDTEKTKIIRHNRKLEKELIPIFKDAIESRDVVGIKSLIDYVGGKNLSSIQFLHSTLYSIEKHKVDKAYDFDLKKHKAKINGILSKLR
jgi:hypothetical protein